MIKFSFFAGSMTLLCGWFLYRIFANLKSKHPDWKYETIQLFFLINLLVIYRFTFHPFSKVDGQVQPLIFEWETAWPFRVNLIPIVNLLDYDSKRDLLINLIGNIAMFIPTGVMTPLIYKKINSFKKVVLTGFLISLAIEIIQLPFAVRASDVDDLILNTLGCMAGYWIYVLVRWIKNMTNKETLV